MPKNTAARVLRSESEQAAKHGVGSRSAEEGGRQMVTAHHLQALGVVGVLHQPACDISAILNTIGLLLYEGEKVSHQNAWPNYLA